MDFTGFTNFTKQYLVNLIVTVSNINEGGMLKLFLSKGKRLLKNK